MNQTRERDVQPFESVVIRFAGETVILHQAENIR